MAININDGVSNVGVHLIPKDKIPPRLNTIGPLLVGGNFRGPGHVAANAGFLELRCVINRECPFTSTNAVDDTLVLNEETIFDYPKHVRELLKTTPGTEGIYLRPELNFRHNYIFGITKREDENGNPQSSISELPIPDNHPSQNSAYKSEQQWRIVRSVFDTGDVLTPEQYFSNARTPQDFTTACDLQPPIWRYTTINKEYDPNRDPDTKTNNILMPQQTNTSICGGVGVHWRLDKATDLFQGEDFFVEFRKSAPATDINSVLNRASEDTDFDGATPDQEASVGGFTESADASAISSTSAELTWADSDYFSVDAKNTFDSNGDPINRGVTGYDENNKVYDDNTYDIRTQAYYVVEVGKGHKDHNYLFFITQRGPVTCVNIRNKKSRIVSVFNSDTSVVGDKTGSVVSGRQLIEAEWFRMNVRHHLGLLVVEFEGPNFKSAPWIIQKTVDVDLNNEKNETVQQPVIMFVPKAKMSLWGGNMLTGFLFGPLQYQESAAFKFPPNVRPFTNKELEERAQHMINASEGQNLSLDKRKENVAQQINEIANQRIALSKINATYSLPAKAKNEVLLTSTDHDIEGIAPGVQGERLDPGRFEPSPFGDLSASQTRKAIRECQAKSKQIVNSMFVQDAQRYTDSTGRNRKGTFFKGDTIKERSEIESSISTVVSESEGDTSGRNVEFKVDVELFSGNHVFLNDDGEATFTLPRCKTPIMTMFRLKSTPLDIPRWETRGFECSHHVMSFSDAWAAQDFTKIEHTGQIQFLLHEEMPAAQENKFGIPFEDADFEDDNDRTEDLLALRDKAFYIEVWGGYKPGPGLEFIEDFVNLTGGSVCNYSQLPGFFKLFTGICYGGDVSYAYGKRVMNCQIFDYTKILQDQRLFNSPFFDGVKDIVAVDELLQFAGFRSAKTDHPRFMLSRLSSNNDNEVHSIIGPDGRMSFSSNYALPSSYARLQQPFFKFNDGDTLYDGIIKIAERGGKLFFFDAYGVAHYENYNDIVVDTLTQGRNAKEQNREAIILSPIFWFTTNHNIWPGQLIFNSLTVQESVSDVFNHVKLLSNTPNNEVLFHDDLSWASVEDPKVEGFIGYLKTVYQAEGIFGSQQSAKSIMEFYKAFRRPPYVVRFETYGQPLRALDIVSVNGQRLRVMRVNSTMDPARNVWWQEVECEWLKPIESEVDPVKTRPQEDLPQQFSVSQVPDPEE